MTRSLMNELYTPYKDPKLEFRSSRRHFKTLSLDELRSPDFNLISDKEYSEEEEEEEMAEIMEQYMSKTRTDYGWGEVILFYNGLDVLTRHILDLRGVVPTKTIADAKTAIQEMAEYSQKWHNGTSRGRSTETSDGLATIQAQLNNLGREIKKVNEKVYVAQVGCEQCKGPHYTKDCPLKEEGKTLKEAYYTCCHKEPRSIDQNFINSNRENEQADSNLIRRIGSNQYAVSTGQNSTPLYKARQTMVPFPSPLDNHYCEEEGNYGPKFTEACGASHINNAIPRKEKDLGRASVSVMPLSTYLNLGLGELVHTRLTVELADRTVKYLKGIAKNILVGIGKFTFPVDFINLDMPEDIKVPLILGRPFLSIARAKIDVYKRKITLRVKEEKIIFKSVKPASSIIKRVYMLNYIELNDLNEPFELRRNQGNDLMPTIKEGEVIKEFRIRNEDLDTGINDYPSYCDDDKKIHIDCAHNLKFSCIIGFEFTHANFFPLLYVNMMSKKFHNSIMKNKMVYKGNNIVGALMNVPIFVGTFFVMTDFAVLENMDAYRDEGMGDVIFGEPLLREANIKSKRFEGMITLYKGDDEVTYQMVQSYLRFKHHTNEQCNKIPPLLKVNKKDAMNGVSHTYQKLKVFYKGVLNLGPDYIRNAKTEEWLIHGHISVHESD
ncbi:putative reverse transcriptase domain-containing protein [Tanacetum coccineum]|uniref:Reverse transcriptase domain-containing protein n=1 Tax=Tanacetum coccineum TaxID=301880 RepID=A0ABQ5AT27_9ASTR